MIYRILGKLMHDSAAIRNRVGSRIFFENAPAGTQGECIIIRHLSGTANAHLLNESDCAQPMVQIDFYADSSSKAHSGYQLIRERLSGFSGAASYLDDDGEEATADVFGVNLLRPGALVNEPRDASDKWSYRFTADFEVFHSQTVPSHL